MADFDLVNLALQTVCPMNEIVCDDKGMPSVMVKIPKQSWKDLGVGDSHEIFPAFVNGDTIKNYITIGKFLSVVQNGRAYSLPCRDPAHDIDYDESFSACKSKGDNWHLPTRLEWMAIALWCLKNGFQPKGNTYWGMDHEKGHQEGNDNIGIKEAIRDPGGSGRTFTGTGPITWSHNGQLDGIYDMCGNIWEWLAGMRLVYGELQVLSRDGVTLDNCAEDTSLSVAADSPNWYAIDGTTGNLIAPNGSGTTANSVKLSWVDNHWRWTTGAIVKVADYGLASFFATDTDSTISDAAKLKLVSLGLIKPDTLKSDFGDEFWARNQESEKFPIVGGSYESNKGINLFSISFFRYRLSPHYSVGLRSAL